MAKLFKVRLGKVHIMFALFVTEYYTEKLLPGKKTNVQHSARTIY